MCAKLCDALACALYPEIRALDDLSARRRVWRAAAARCRCSPVLIVWAALGMAGVVVGTAITEDFVSPPWWRPLATAINKLYVLWLVLAVSYPYLARTRMTRLLRQELAEHGVPICVHCGYDLRCRVGDVCPECGQPLPQPPADS